MQSNSSDILLGLNERRKKKKHFVSRVFLMNTFVEIGLQKHFQIFSYRRDSERKGQKTSSITVSLNASLSKNCKNRSSYISWAWFGTNGNCFLTMLNNEIKRNRPISLPKKWLLHLYSIHKSSIISATLENETVSVSRVGSAWTGAVKQWERFRSVNCSVLQSNVSIRWSNHLSSTIFLQDLHCQTRKSLPAFSLRIKRH